MSGRPPPEPPPVVPYARPAQQASDFTPGDYAYCAVATAMFIGLLALPAILATDIENVYARYKLALPTATSTLLAVGHAVRSTGGAYWLWVVPALVPLAVRRVPRRARERAFLLLVLSAGCLGVLMIWSLYLPMMRLLQSLK